MMLDASTQFFFDQEKVLKSLSRAEAKQLSRIGAFVRRRARSKTRRRKKTADPGQAPSVHTKSKFRTLKNVRFQYDQKTSSVIVGPIKLSTSKVTGNNPLPELLHFGGQTWIEEDGERKRATYEAHPWMSDALDEEIAEGTLADVWEDSLVA